MIAILGAIEREIAGLLKQMNSADQPEVNYYKGKIYNKEIVLVRTGAGPKNAKTAAEKLCSCCRPDMILSVGWAGGTKKEISYGDIVIADILYSESQKQPIFPDRNLCDLAVRTLKLKEKRPHVGGSLTVSRPLLLPQEKKDAGEKWPVVMVEMESYEVASIASRERIPFLVIRVITDPVEVKASLGPPQTSYPQENLNACLLSIVKAA